jgi:hypothetical protein
VSDRLPTKHAFPIKHILEMHEALQLGIDYTLVIVYVCPQNELSSKRLKGIVIEDEMGKCISLAQARKKLRGIKVEAFVVRAPIIPGEATVVYNMNPAQQNAAAEEKASEEEKAAEEKKACGEEKAVAKDGVL